MADTLAANLAEVTQPLIAATVALMPQTAPTMALVEKIMTGKGHGSVLLPRVNATFGIQTPTEGDEITASSQFDLISTTITPTLRAIMVRISERAEYFSRDDIVSYVSKELARAQGQDIDTDITAEFTNFGGTDVGATNRNLYLRDVRRGRRQLMSTAVTSGGPPNGPMFLVVSPMQEEMFLADAGGEGYKSVSSDVSPNIATGLSQDIINNYFVGSWYGVKVFRDGYITSSSSAFSGGLFVREALQLIMSKDWDMETFKVPHWIGPVIRCVADYNSGVGKFSAWGIEVLSNDTAP